jgi:hypothetical protein
LQYFKVQPSGEDGLGTVPTNSNAAWARVGEQITKAWANVETQAQNAI